MRTRRYVTLFILAGLLMVSLGIIFDLQNWTPYDTIPLTLGTTLLAIVLVNFLWERSGGEPIRNSLEVLSRASEIVSDSIDTGVRRIYHQRQAINYEAVHSKIATAKNVYFLSLVFKVNQSLDLRKSMLECVANGGSIRILLSDPYPDHRSTSAPTPLLLRQHAEHDTTNNRIPAEIKDTLDFLGDIQSEIVRQSPTRRKAFEIRLVSDYVIYWSLAFVDGAVLVTHYCNKRQGLGCPTLYVEKTASARSLFDIYAQEFEFLWKKARPWEPAVDPSVLT